MFKHNYTLFSTQDSLSSTLGIPDGIMSSPIQHLESTKRKEHALELNTRVSIATGTKWWLSFKCAYLVLFLFSASSATAPASLVVCVLYEGARVSGHVVSHTSTFPPFHWMMDEPLGSYTYIQWVPVCRGCWQCQSNNYFVDQSMIAWWGWLYINTCI